jgi:hypothetical protein
MPVRILPSHPNLAHLKYQARDLLKAHAARKPEAAQRLREFHPDFKGATDATIFDTRLSLSGAQLAIARESGFPSWSRLKRHIEKPTLADRLNLPHHERIDDPLFRRAVALLDAGDAKGLQAHLKEHPVLARQRLVFEGRNYFQNPSLLEFVAENPVRHATLPANILEVAKVILDAGVDRAALNETLKLVATGSVARECRAQLPLIDLLCDRGADPGSAVQIAAVSWSRFRRSSNVALALNFRWPQHWDESKTLVACCRARRVQIGIWRYRSQRTGAIFRSCVCCSTPAKIPIVTIPSAAIPTQRRYIRLRAAATTKW